MTGLAQIGFGLATDVWMLFLARFLGGLGSAFVAPPIMAFVADVTTYEERGKVWECWVPLCLLAL